MGGAAEGRYDADAELEELYAAITGRPAFSYSPGSDPLYRSYADRYVQNGRLAMRDTQGRAAALTGGYGSSYAQSVGQQRYDEYLRSLGEVMPELYGLAWQRYQAEGDRLRGAYDMTRQRGEDAYRRERDALADERYEAERQREAEALARKQQQESYEQLYKLIASTGYVPTDEELEAAGLTREQAEALRAEYLRSTKKKKSSSGGWSGGGRRNSRKKNRGKGRSGSRSGSASGRAGAARSALTAGALAGFARYRGGGGR